MTGQKQVCEKNSLRGTIRGTLAEISALRSSATEKAIDAQFGLAREPNKLRRLRERWLSNRRGVGSITC